MRFRNIFPAAIACCAFLYLSPGIGGAFDWFEAKRKPFECAFEEDNNPPLDLNSDAHELYLQARELESSKPVLSKDEQADTSLMYIQAMEQGHWKAKAQMVVRYLDGIGVDRNSAIAARLARELMNDGIPTGSFIFGQFKAKGWGTGKNEKEGMQIIHKAAALGSKDAQYMLGEYYIYQGSHDVLGLKYHVCAMHQGHSGSAGAIASYLDIVEENYPMFSEYLLRAGGLGRQQSLSTLMQVFFADHPDTNKGFPANPGITKFAQERHDQLESTPRQTFPSIGKECPLPEHPTLGNGRQLPSKLKEACGGMWPDEAYPELKDW